MLLPHSNDDRLPVGHAWLRQALQLQTPAPAVESYVSPESRRRTEINSDRVVEVYPARFATGDSIAMNLRFALRYEPTDLGTLVAEFKAMDPEELATWVRAEPTGAYSRRAWFLYETFTGRTLDVEDARFGNYVEALDPKRHIVGVRRNSRRHRVIDNLLGGPGLCPTIRLTAKLKQQIGLRIDDEAKAMIARYDPATLARAVSYLYTKETRSSFAIEGETPNPNRTARFVAALQAALVFDPADKAALVRLQGDIVDPRYAARDWRDLQVYVGKTGAGFREEVHCIFPRAADVSSLMAAWAVLLRRLDAGAVDPVVAAALASFSFVFIHPFEDGNGRIHRFLIHHILAKRGYSPPGIVFPVSAAILRDSAGYDVGLETFSKPIMAYIQWRQAPGGPIVVENDTADLYRYFDATRFAEYLYDRVADTVRRDLKEELGFIAAYDQAFAAVQDIVDMPDRRAAQLIRFCMQNDGRLAKGRRQEFAELTDDEIAAIEGAVRAAMGADEGPSSGESDGA